MDIQKRDFLIAGLGAGVLASSAGAQQQPAPHVPIVGRGGLPASDEDIHGIGPGRWQNSGRQPSSVDLNYKPRRVNKVIELLEDDQPAFSQTRACGLAWTPTRRAGKWPGPIAT
jgi:hypothetical protein